MNATENSRKIRELQNNGRSAYADIYRTITAGPSGQRADLRVGRVWYTPDGYYEFALVDMTTGERAGFAHWDASVGAWSITQEDYDGALSWRGWSSALSVGLDVLIYGEHAALGRHDTRRISGGWITKDRADTQRRTARV